MPGTDRDLFDPDDEVGFAAAVEPRPRRRWWRALVAVSVATGVAAVLGGAWALASVFGTIDSLDRFGPPPAPADGQAPITAPDSVVKLDGDPVTFLLFSTGTTRMTAEEARTLNIPDFGHRGRDELTDVIMLVTVDPDDRLVDVLSLPRDTWLEDWNNKLNAVYPLSNVYELADEVEELTGIPVDHMVEVNMVGFSRLVDTLGGIDIHLDRRIRDHKSHLDPVGPGVVHMDGRTALAFVRSRSPQEWEPDRQRWSVHVAEASDFGRMRKQQQFLSAVADELAGPKLVTRLRGLLGVAQSSLRVDQDLSSGLIASLGRSLAGGSVEVHTWTLPSRDGRAGAAWVTRPTIGPGEGRLGEVLSWWDEPPTVYTD